MPGGGSGAAMGAGDRQHAGLAGGVGAQQGVEPLAAHLQQLRRALEAVWPALAAA